MDVREHERVAFRPADTTLCHVERTIAGSRWLPGNTQDFTRAIIQLEYDSEAKIAAHFDHRSKSEAIV